MIELKIFIVSIMIPMELTLAIVGWLIYRAKTNHKPSPYFKYLMIGALFALKTERGIPDESGLSDRLYSTAIEELTDCKGGNLPDDDPFMKAYRTENYLKFAYLVLLQTKKEYVLEDRLRLENELECPSTVKRLSWYGLSTPFHITRNR